ncbi:TetR/AcrR family transcriptional regulator [Tomitella biformata]|uniref:TetR/AcrR family transcriptional regulator n=1 Tax=Tomitella biformata TaxID=630403 RepID=UPI000684AF0E|nr:TetR/AcrR family transcriptional regulator [Tomitella biformata]
MVSPALLHTLPVTERGVRRRNELIDAARIVFERAGYLESRLTDITRQAGCATGSFYTYFNNKEEIFAAVLDRAQEDMLHPGMGRVPGDDVYAALEAANRAYLLAYRRNAKMMALMEQVATIDDGFREQRRRRGRVFIERNAKAIAGLQERGLADPELDPTLASRALSSMVDQVAYSVFVVDRASKVGLEDLVHTVTRIWANGLRMTTPDKPKISADNQEEL